MRLKHPTAARCGAPPKFGWPNCYMQATTVYYVYTGAAEDECYFRCNHHQLTEAELAKLGPWYKETL